MVMHYNHDTGDYGPYMLDDYTEDLASQHSVRNLIGDEFTLANLKAEIPGDHVHECDTFHQY